MGNINAPGPLGAISGGAAGTVAGAIAGYISAGVVYNGLKPK